MVSCKCKIAVQAAVLAQRRFLNWTPALVHVSRSFHLQLFVRHHEVQNEAGIQRLAANKCMLASLMNCPSMHIRRRVIMCWCYCSAGAHPPRRGTPWSWHSLRPR